MKQSIVIERLENKIAEQEAKIKELTKSLKKSEKVVDKISSVELTNLKAENKKLKADNKKYQEENERLKSQVEKLIEGHKAKDRKVWELQTLNDTRNRFLEALFGDGENGEKIDAKQFWKDIDEAKRKSDEDYWDGIDLTEEDILGP